MRLSDGKAPNPDPTNLLVGSGLERLEDAAGTDFQDPPVESGLERLEAVVRTDMQNPPIESSPERLEGAVGTISTQDPVRSGLERPDNAAKPPAYKTYLCRTPVLRVLWTGPGNGDSGGRLLAAIPKPRTALAP